MPTYDFQCGACDHTFSQTLSFSDPHPKSCPVCKKRKVGQVMTTIPAFHARCSPANPRRGRGAGIGNRPKV